MATTNNNAGDGLGGFSPNKASKEDLSNGSDAGLAGSSRIFSAQQLPYILERYKHEVQKAKDLGVNTEQGKVHAKNAEKIKVLLIEYQRAHPETFHSMASGTEGGNSESSSFSNGEGGSQKVQSPAQLQHAQLQQSSASATATASAQQQQQQQQSPAASTLNEIILKSKALLTKELEKYTTLKRYYNKQLSDFEKVKQVVSNASSLNQETKTKLFNQQLELQKELERVRGQMLQVSKSIKQLHEASTGMLASTSKNSSDSPPIKQENIHDDKSAIKGFNNNTKNDNNNNNVNKSNLVQSGVVTSPPSIAAQQQQPLQPQSQSQSQSQLHQHAHAHAQLHQPAQVLPPPASSLSLSHGSMTMFTPYNSNQPIYSKTQLLSYLKQLTFEEKLLVSHVSASNKVIIDPDVETLLDELVKEFLELVIDFSSKLARHRNDTYLTLSDLKLNLERNWGITVNGDTDAYSNNSSISLITRARKRSYGPTEAYINKLRKIYTNSAVKSKKLAPADKNERNENEDEEV